MNRLRGENLQIWARLSTPTPVLEYWVLWHLQKAKMYQYVVHSHRSNMKKDRATDALQWAAMA